MRFLPFTQECIRKAGRTWRLSRRTSGSPTGYGSWIRIDYSAGMVSPEEIADWYGAIDVLAACTYAEGRALPIIEAQSCGVPVITTDASSMTELNPHGISIPGAPFWNGVHQAWWTRPYYPR